VKEFPDNNELSHYSPILQMKGKGNL